MTLTRASWLFVALAMIGCGTTPAEPDGGPGTDACSTCNVDGGGDVEDGGQDGGQPDGGQSDGGQDGGEPPPPPEPVVVSLSTTGHDRFFAVTHDADGNIYATGQIADSLEATADYEIMVAKFSPAGVLDTTFGGGDGVARVNVSTGGRAAEVARGIVVQSSGRIVVGGTAEHDPSAAGLLANDTDIVLVGFTSTGELDDTFGTDGIDWIDLGTAVVDSSGAEARLAGADAQWGLAVDSMDRLVIHGATRAPDPRLDTDYAIVRRLEDGGPDTAFAGGAGVVTMDIGMTAAGARAVTVLADDSIIGAGYTTATTLVRDPAASSQQPVLWKVTSAGELDATFATADATTTPGVFYDFATPLPERRNAEAYGAAVLSDGRLVTIGYGPTAITGGMGTDLVSFRFSAAGALDATYGTAGLTYVDVGMLGDNGRLIVALPDDRTLSVGQARPAPPSGGTAEIDAIVLILSEDGVPDAAFGEGGFRTYDLAGSDQFWGAHVHEATAGDSVAIVGVAGGTVVGTDDDDAVILVLPL